MLALALMAAVAGWIALRPLTRKTGTLYLRSLDCIVVCGGCMLQPAVWYDARVVNC